MSNNNIEQVLENLRSLTPNHPDFHVFHKQTYTQKQWKYQMKTSQGKENLRKKSTRLSTRQEVNVATIDDLDKILNIESNKSYTKKWKRLGKRFKINRLMDYYGKNMEEILKVYEKIEPKDVEYDEKQGKIISIVKDIFKDE